MGQIPFAQFLICLGDGGNPENFTQAPLAMMSRGFSTTVSTTKITVPGFPDEDAMVDEQSVPNTRSRSITGKGILSAANVNIWETLQGETFNAQIQMLDITGTPIKTWTGPVNLTQFNLTGERTNVVNMDLTLEQAGKLVFDKSP